MMRPMTTDDDYDFQFEVSSNAAATLTDTLDVGTEYGFI